MSAALDSSKPHSECKKRSSSPRRESELDCPPSKRSKADKGDEESAVRVAGSSTDEKNIVDEASAVGDSSGKPEHKDDSSKAAEKPDSAAKGGCEEPSSAPREKERSDSAAFAAAEALASLTGGGGGGGNQGRGSSSIDDPDKEVMLPCSSRQAALDDKDRSSRPSCSTSSSNFNTNFTSSSSTTTSSSSTGKDRVRIRGRPAEAAVADSSSSVLGGAERKDPRKGSNQDQKDKNREDEEDDEDEEEEDDDSLAGSSSSTASSSAASDNEENEEGECAIVAVRMAPEVRQSVSLLAQVQMRLDALEKKGARLHQRLELKLSRQRRPHLDQRGAITQTIPGFWVTALLNHPHLSAHIDENDEDALSYMTNLEIETFKNNKLGYRICFHFRRNPFFQNKVIVKELHLGMGGSPVSFSNPILWHRGQNLIGNGEPRRTAQGVYQSFFHWFSDHSSPGRDEIAQILKDDLYRNPLRYYLTPLWEPRQNGSTPKPPDNSNGDECVIISDSDDDQEVVSQDKRQEREEEEDEEEDEGRIAGPDDSDQEAGESSFEEREEEDLDVEEVGDSRDSGGCEARPQGEEEEDQIDVNEDEEEEASEQS